MLKDKITCMIFSCNKFSDLWDGNMKMLRKNWPDKDFETYIITDKPTERTFSDAKVIAAGADVEWTDRLKYALQYVKTKYVFLTLDDYFLIKSVSSERMEKYVDKMEEGGFDYIRFFKRPTTATRDELPDFKGLYHVENSHMYSVNLYSCLWKKEFLAYTVKEPRTPWDYEVQLHERAMEYNAKCLVCLNKEYEILDVVRKGRILRQAYWYFKRHPGIYNGNREVQSWWFEIKLFFKTEINRHCPDYMRDGLRDIYVKCGGTTFVKKTKE
jgi:hypothetical protein